MIGYRRLTLEQRYQIRALKDTKISIREMARVLKLSPSTISREFKRNSKNYCPENANRSARRKRIRPGPERKVTGEVRTRVDQLLYVQWSPIQISTHLKKENISVSHETIYQYVYQQNIEAKDRELYLNLRRKKRWRKSAEKLKNQKGCSSRPDRVNIRLRPEIVEKRERVGDFERDLMLGKNGRLVTIVDRASKLVKIAKISSSSAAETHQATVRLLCGFKVHTITNDNGHEFSFHKQTAQELNAEVYFADPHCPWQRGTNENTNGLIRQYLPKGTDFGSVTEEDLKRIEDLLNTRPRKILGYRTPEEVHRLLSQGVALGS